MTFYVRIRKIGPDPDPTKRSVSDRIRSSTMGVTTKLNPQQIMEQQMMEELQKRKEEQLREAAKREVQISFSCACAERGITQYTVVLAHAQREILNSFSRACADRETVCLAHAQREILNSFSRANAE